MADFFIKKNNTRPKLVATIYDEDGDPLNLTAATVRFVMQKPGAAVKINAAMTITDAPNGKVEYAWSSADTDTPGTYHAEIQITLASDVYTAPSNGYLSVTILAQLG